MPRRIDQPYRPRIIAPAQAEKEDPEIVLERTRPTKPDAPNVLGTTERCDNDGDNAFL